MFEMIREQHTFTAWKIADRKMVTWQETVLADVLVRDDGCKLILLEEKADRSAHFRFKKADIGFEFHANRRHWGGTITDTYSVYLEFKLGQKLGQAAWPLDHAWLNEFAEAIDAGLRAWPPKSEAENVPVGVVSFYVRTRGAIPGVDRELPAEESSYRFELGHPVNIRLIPPSDRWQHRIDTFRCHDVGDRWFRPPDATREYETLVRDNGIQLVRVNTLRGPLDDGPDSYRYLDRDLSFDFEAERRLSLLLVTDTWEVRLNPRRRDGLSPQLREQLGAAKTADVIANIEEALFAWPLAKGYQREVPINRVMFLDAN